MISVLPRFAARNQIELLLNIEDGNEINSDKTNVDDLPQVGRTLISTIARVPQGKSLLIGDIHAIRIPMKVARSQY